MYKHFLAGQGQDREGGNFQSSENLMGKAEIYWSQPAREVPNQPWQITGKTKFVSSPESWLEEVKTAKRSTNHITQQKSVPPPNHQESIENNRLTIQHTNHHYKYEEAKHIHQSHLKHLILLNLINKYIPTLSVHSFPAKYHSPSHSIATVCAAASAFPATAF